MRVKLSLTYFVICQWVSVLRRNDPGVWYTRTSSLLAECQTLTEKKCGRTSVDLEKYKLFNSEAGNNRDFLLCGEKKRTTYKFDATVAV